MNLHLEKKLRSLLDMGVLVQGDAAVSAYNSPSILVKKPGGDQETIAGWRWCVDFRRINNALHVPVQDLPSIDEILDMLGKRPGEPKMPPAGILSKFDMSEAYHALTVDPRDRHILCCSAGGRQYAYTRAPMGCAPSSAWLISTISKITSKIYWGPGLCRGRPALNNFVVVFADDFLVFSANAEEHRHHLTFIFALFHLHNFTLSLKKSSIGKEKQSFLAHEIYTKPYLSIRPDREKCIAISKMESPTDVTGVRRLLGCASYYRRYIDQYSEKADPLTELLKDDKEWEWTRECEKAAQALKDSLTSFPVLACRDYSLPIIIRCDGSREGIGAVLCQANRMTAWMKAAVDPNTGLRLSRALTGTHTVNKIVSTDPPGGRASIYQPQWPSENNSKRDKSPKDGNNTKQLSLLLEKQDKAKNSSVRVLGYLSRKCKPNERNWGNTAEWECLALVYSISKWRHYLLGEEHFFVITDHANLASLLAKKANDSTSTRLTRWALILQEYNFSLVHTSGVDLADADCLSRDPLPPPEGDSEVIREVGQHLDMPGGKPETHHLYPIENGVRTIMPNGMVDMKANRACGRWKAIHIAHGLSSEAMATEGCDIQWIAGSETDELCEELFTQRTGATALGDMRRIPERIAKGDLALGKIDLLSFSTPCVGLSMAHNFNKKKTPKPTSPDSEELFKLIGPITQAIAPRVVTIEQVRPTASTVHLYDNIIAELAKMGYKPQARICNTALYGSYTSRTRWIMVADRLKEAILLPQPKLKFSGCDPIMLDAERVPLHFRFDGPYSRTNTKEDIPSHQSHLVGVIRKGGKGNRIYAVKNHPAPTITASSSGWAGRGELLLDKFGPRKWTLPELMDIHNFTATAKRQMANLTRNVQGHLVGNTTPVAAMRAHMLEIEKALQKEDAGTQPGSTVSGNPAHAEIRELQVAMIQASEQAPSLEQFKVAQLEDPAISTMIMFLQDSREWTLTKKKKMAEDLPSQWRKYWPHLYTWTTTGY